MKSRVMISPTHINHDPYLSTKANPFFSPFTLICHGALVNPIDDNSFFFSCRLLLASNEQLIQHPSFHYMAQIQQSCALNLCISQYSLSLNHSSISQLVVSNFVYTIKCDILPDTAVCKEKSRKFHSKTSKIEGKKPYLTPKILALLHIILPVSSRFNVFLLHIIPKQTQQYNFTLKRYKRNMNTNYTSSQEKRSGEQKKKCFMSVFFGCSVDAP